MFEFSELLFENIYFEASNSSVGLAVSFGCTMFYLCRTTPQTFAEHPITRMRPTHIGKHALKMESNNSSVTPENLPYSHYYPYIPFSIPSHPSPSKEASFFCSVQGRKNWRRIIGGGSTAEEWE